MTLYTSDYLEYYLTLVAWLVQNGIWAVLVASGIVALPFIVIVVQEWLRVREEGADEGNKGVLSSMRIENRVWVAIVVIMFACVPFIPVDLNTIQFDRTRSIQCQVTLALPNETQWGVAFTTLNDRSARVPIWWFFMHSISRAVSGAASASIPCGTDLRQMRMEINATRINDPALAQEVADFTRDCYGPARAKLFTHGTALNEQEASDVRWIGSNYFSDTTGFYDTHRSRTPHEAFPYDATRDEGLAEVPSGAGYPTCRQWWLDANDGLRARLLEQVNPTLLQRFGQWAGWLIRAEVDDAVIRAIASPQQETLREAQVYTDHGGRIGMTVPNLAARIAADVGVLVTGPLVSAPAMDAMRQSLPMVLALLKMALVICIPLVLIIGTYELKTVITVSCVQFAFTLVGFWHDLARWIDSTILDALYGWSSPHSNLNPLLGLNNTFQDMILSWFVVPMMFLILPMFWVSALTWVGIHAGSAVQGFVMGTNDVKGAGSQGATTLIKAKHGK